MKPARHLRIVPSPPPSGVQRRRPKDPVADLYRAECHAYEGDCQKPCRYRLATSKCVLTVADGGPYSQAETALHMGWTHQYIDVVEKVAVRKLRDLARRFPKSAWAQSVAHLLQLMTGDQNAKR